MVRNPAKDVERSRYQFGLNPGYDDLEELRSEAERIATDYSQEFGGELRGIDVEKGVQNILEALEEGETATGELVKGLNGDNMKLNELLKDLESSGILYSRPDIFSSRNRFLYGINAVEAIEDFYGIERKEDT